MKYPKTNNYVNTAGMSQLTYCITRVCALLLGIISGISHAGTTTLTGVDVCEYTEDIRFGYDVYMEAGSITNVGERALDVAMSYSLLTVDWNGNLLPTTPVCTFTPATGGKFEMIIGSSSSTQARLITPATVPADRTLIGRATCTANTIQGRNYLYGVQKIGQRVAISPSHAGGQRRVMVENLWIEMGNLRNTAVGGGQSGHVELDTKPYCKAVGNGTVTINYEDYVTYNASNSATNNTVKLAQITSVGSYYGNAVYDIVGGGGNLESKCDLVVNGRKTAWGARTTMDQGGNVEMQIMGVPAGTQLSGNVNLTVSMH